MCGSVCVCVLISCVIYQPEVTRDRFEVMLVSGRSSQHHRYNRRNEEGSTSHRRLGKCLLISAKMPGCFLIHILQHTAVALLLIIQEESCGYLMLCCRAFFQCTFPALHSSLFAPLRLPHAVSCIVRYVIPTYSLLFSKKQEPLLCGSAAQSQH